MKSKTTDELRTSIQSNYNKYLPNLDLSEGTPERDIFIEAPIDGILRDVWDESVYVSKLHAPHKYYNELQETDIDNYIFQYGIVSRAATYATGTVTFYTYNAPSSDIIISTGTRIATNSNPQVEFITTSAVTIYVETNMTYYNITNERWEATLPVRALISGPNSRAGKGSITRILSNINGIDGCINAEAILGGEPKESVESRLQRVIQKFQGRDIGSTVGLQSFIQSYSSTANIVGANDPLMLRDNGMGGAIDIYLIDETLETTSESISVTSTGLANPINVNYTTTTYKMISQPVHQIVSFIRNGIVQTPDKYELQKDTGLLNKSTRASDLLSLLATSGYQEWGFLTTVSGSSASGLSNTTTKYGCRISINGGAYEHILVQGSLAQTLATACSTINGQLIGATCVFNSDTGSIKVTSTSTGNISTVAIVDGGATGQDANLFQSLYNTNASANPAVPGEDIVPFFHGESFEIAYTYNTTLETLETTINSESNHYHGRDYLVREMTRIDIDMYLKFKEVAGQDFNAVSSVVNNIVNGYIDSVKTQDRLELTDIIRVITQINGVDNIDLSTISITPIGGGTKVGSDIYIGKNQYMSSGTFTIVRWTS